MSSYPPQQDYSQPTYLHPQHQHQQQQPQHPPYAPARASSVSSHNLDASTAGGQLTPYAQPYAQPHQHQQLQPYLPAQPQQLQPYAPQQPPYERRPSQHSHHSHRSHRSHHSARSEARDVEKRPSFGDTLVLIWGTVVGAISGRRR